MGPSLAVRGYRSAVPNGRTLGPERVSVALIENSRLLRDRLSEFLNRQPGFQAVISAPSAADAMERLQAVRPQVIMVGSCADSLVCHTCVRSIKQAMPEARVVTMNVSVTQDNLIRLIEEGADALLLQDATLHELLRTLRLASGGRNVVPDQLVPVLFSQLAASPVAGKRSLGAAGEGGQLGHLTHREREVSDLITAGLRNQAVADHLAISLHTVKTHVHNILAKLGLQSRLQIPVYMRQHGG